MPQHNDAALIFTVAVPPRQPPTTPRPPKSHWTDADLRANLPRLRLPDQLAALGPDRFADGICRFLFGRWAEDTMIDEITRATATNRFDPDAFAAEILQSDERQTQQDQPLPSPFDYRFPFTYPPIRQTKGQGSALDPLGPRGPRPPSFENQEG